MAKQKKETKDQWTRKMRRRHPNASKAQLAAWWKLKAQPRPRLWGDEFLSAQDAKYAAEDAIDDAVYHTFKALEKYDLNLDAMDRAGHALAPFVTPMTQALEKALRKPPRGGRR